MTHQRECVFDQDADRRRKGSARRTQEDLENVRSFVENMLSVIRDGNEENTELIITLVRAGAPLEEIQAVVEQLADTPTPHASPRNTAPDDAPNNHTSNFFDQQ